MLIPIIFFVSGFLIGFFIKRNKKQIKESINQPKKQFVRSKAFASKPQRKRPKVRDDLAAIEIERDNGAY